jgi:predicted deacylase
MAHVIQRQIVDQADHVLELHGGDLVEWLIPFCMYSHTGKSEIDRRSMELTQSYGLPILQIPSWDGRFSHEGGLYSTACELGKPSVLAEAGGQGLADPEAVNVHVQGIKGVLTCLGMLPGTGPQTEQQPVTSRHVPMRAPMTGVLRTHTLPGSMVREGDLVAEITDYFGTVLCPVHAAISGTVLYIVTSLSVRAGEPMLSIADFEAGY